MDPVFFDTPADFRAWLERHRDSASELLVGFWKKGTVKPSIDWPQARDQALCFGWIDGVRKSLGPDSSRSASPRAGRAAYGARSTSPASVRSRPKER